MEPVRPRHDRAYHRLSEKHLPAYLQEFEFRFNNRENPYLFRDTISEVGRGRSIAIRGTRSGLTSFVACPLSFKGSARSIGNLG